MDVGDTITRLAVEGCPLSDNEPRRVASLTTAPGPSSAITVPRASRPLSVVPRRVQSVNVKIVKATMKPGVNGRPEFTPVTQTFVDVTESTANTTYILNAVQRKWGAQYVIVTSDGLQIEDGSGTQGRLKTVVVVLWGYSRTSHNGPSQERTHMI